MQTLPQAFRLGPDGIYRCAAFEQFEWVRHGFGTRLANPVVEVTLRQIHSDGVVNARGVRDGEREGDALVTDEVGRSIGVRTADCVPILLLDEKNRAVAAVHAGWRGTAAGVAARTMERMRTEFGSDAGDVYAAVGPSIRACCYEVGREVAERFDAAVCMERDGKHQIDLPEANRRQMEAAGLRPERIFDCGLCTMCESARFFSYRREPGNPGRMTAAICRLF